MTQQHEIESGCSNKSFALLENKSMTGEFAVRTSLCRGTKGAGLTAHIGVSLRLSHSFRSRHVVIEKRCFLWNYVERS